MVYQFYQIKTIDRSIDLIILNASNLVATEAWGIKQQMLHRGLEMIKSYLLFYSPSLGDNLEF